MLFYCSYGYLMNPKQELTKKLLKGRCILHASTLISIIHKNTFGFHHFLPFIHVDCPNVQRWMANTRNNIQSPLMKQHILFNHWPHQQMWHLAIQFVKLEYHYTNKQTSQCVDDEIEILYWACTLSCCILHIWTQSSDKNGRISICFYSKILNGFQNEFI